MQDNSLTHYDKCPLAHIWPKMVVIHPSLGFEWVVKNNNIKNRGIPDSLSLAKTRSRERECAAAASLTTALILTTIYVKTRITQSKMAYGITIRSATFIVE